MTKLRATITVEYEPDPEDYAGNELDGPATAEQMAQIDREAITDTAGDFIDNFDADEIKVEVVVIQ